MDGRFRAGLGLTHIQLGRLAGLLGESIEQRAELKLAEERHDSVPIILACPAGFEIEFDRNIGNDLTQFAAEQGILPPGFQLVPIAFWDLGQVAVHAFQIPELLKQGHGGLLADALNSRDVVAGVPDQGLEIDQLSGVELVFLLDLLWAVVDCLGQLLAGQPDGYLVGSQLQQVTVTGQDDDLYALLADFSGHGAEHIVGLETVGLQNRNPKCIHNLPDPFDLQSQIVRHFLSGALVIGIQVVAESSADVERHRQVLRGFLFQQPQDHRGEAKGAGGRFTGGGHPAGRIAPPGEGVVGPIGQGMPIDEIQTGSGTHRGGPMMRGASQKAQSWLAGPLARTASTNSTDLPAREDRSMSSDRTLPSWVWSHCPRFWSAAPSAR